MVPAPRKALKLRRAFRLPGRVGTRSTSRGASFLPLPGEQPAMLLRVQVMGCRDLAGKNGSASVDPYVTISVLGKRHQTPVAKRNGSPLYVPKDATFDFPIYFSLADRLGVIEMVVWDRKDVLRKEYLGEVALSLEELFGEGAGADGAEISWASDQNKSLSFPVVSTRCNTTSSGAIDVKIGFTQVPGMPDVNIRAVYAELVKRSRPSLVSAPPTEGIGTVRSSLAPGQSSPGDGYVDDGLSSSDDLEDSSDYEDDDIATDTELTLQPRTPLLDLYGPPHNGEHTLRSPTQSVSRISHAIALPIPITPSPPVYTQHSTYVLNEEPDHVALVPPEEPSKARQSTQRPRPHRAETLPNPALATTPTEFPLASSSKVGFLPRMLRRPAGIGARSISTSQTPHGSAPPVSARSVSAGSPSLAHSQLPSETHTSTLAPEDDQARSPPSHATGQRRPSGLRMRGFTNRSLKSVDVVAASGRVVGRRKGKRTRAKGTYNFEAANDIVGIVTLDIQGATDLPRLKNITRTGWDMDPFVVISFGKKVFRTRVIRHSLNPVWDEKLLFHVRRYETNFNVQLTVLDWDKLTSNDYVGEVQFNVSELLGDTPKKDELTGLYDAEELEKSRVARGKEFNLRLKTEKEAVWEAKHNPTLSFRAKYQAYDALRQQFWRKYLKQYDADDTDTISRLELTSMLDSLGSTLSASTVDSFFASHGKSPARDELTITEAVQCLEDELRRPEEERERVDSADYRPPDTGFVTPTIPGAVDGLGLSLALDKMSFAGPPGNLGEDGIGPSVDPSAQSPVLVQTFPTEPSEMVLGDPALNGRRENIKDRRRASADLSVLSPPSRRLLRQEGYSSGSEADYDPSPSTTPGTSISHPLQQGPPSPIFERVINVKNCPLCHRPRLSKKAEVDIITHLAICASQDWDRVDRIMVGNFVTPSQAQRKWYTKLVGKVSRGAYQLGANSANIIVQNRLTGQLEEEKMQVYVRLGIRLLYKGAKSTMEGARARRLLKSMTIKQGIKFDSPESARDIIPFIRFHRLNTEEFLDPVESYRTFNQFFYRRLKPGSRPVESPNDPTRLVSCADCRLMTFETVSEATRLWIKGREFTVGRLFGPGYRNLAERYAGGALAIFRLAPQDYHRFHSPVDGVIGAMSYIAGEYHTVNPQAIRTGLDVYGENARKVVPIDSPQFGKVMAVCVGATMVGSIITTVQEGQQVKRGDEFGYFAFGGSTIVIVFEKGVVDWDEDLLVNGRASLETLVRVGMGIGRCRRPNTRTQSSTS